MTLPEKLSQLRLTTMAPNLETMTREAAAQNLSFAAALERLADLELEARHGRAIERRFQLSRLPAQPSLDQFHFAHHKSASQAKNRILHLLDLDFLQQGTNVVIIGNPGVGKTFLAKILGWRACQANVRVLFTTAMEMLNQLLASQVDHSLVRKLKVYTEPTSLIVTNSVTWRLTSRLPTCSTRSSPLAMVTSAARLSRPTPRSPTGATSSTTPPLPPPLPTGWWKTPRSFCWGEKACVKLRRARPPPSS